MNVIKDRYGNELKTPDHRPTLQQSISSWALTNELIELGYCHNFQYERSDIADYIYQVSALVDKALAISASSHGERKTVM